MSQIVPDIAPLHKKSNQYLFKNKTPLRESQNTGLRLKHPHVPQRARQTALEKRSSYRYCPSLRKVQYHIVRPLLNFWFLQQKKRTQGDNLPSPACGSLWGSPYSNLTPQELQGNLQSPATENLTVMEMEEGLATTSIWILADGVHTCFAQVAIPTNGFAHLQNQVRDTQGNWWSTDLSVLDPQVRSFAGSRAQYVHAQERR